MEHEHQDRCRRINGHASNGHIPAGAGDSPANSEQYQSSNPAEGQAGELLAPQSFEYDFEGQKVQTVVKDAKHGGSPAMFARCTHYDRWRTRDAMLTLNRDI